VTERQADRVTPEELAAEGVTALPDKEVLSLLDLNANIDLAPDAAAARPIAPPTRFRTSPAPRSR
jgi:hypothetical protein